ncbi:hypothetical protein B0H17DRAFT_1145920 [Mycena rosella]|uniref:Uncharacterized protein n=1 Tax=Mycena rosella TaxID=1033263 RepID=A0AAD7CQ02_MYCRO|nr:hypothetical protein B0H17DRAFT_1145920 [Mycena rosella]
MQKTRRRQAAAGRRNWKASRRLRKKTPGSSESNATTAYMIELSAVDRLYTPRQCATAFMSLMEYKGLAAAGLVEVGLRGGRCYRNPGDGGVTGQVEARERFDGGGRTQEGLMGIRGPVSTPKVVQLRVIRSVCIRSTRWTALAPDFCSGMELRTTAQSMRGGNRDICCENAVKFGSKWEGGI